MTVAWRDWWIRDNEGLPSIASRLGMSPQYNMILPIRGT